MLKLSREDSRIVSIRFKQQKTGSSAFTRQSKYTFQTFRMYHFTA